MKSDVYLQTLMITVALVLSCLVCIADAHPADCSQENPAIDYVIDAFQHLTVRGEWLGFHRGPAPDTTPACIPLGFFDPFEILKCQTNEHTQGIARSPRTGIKPIFYVTRSGNVNNSDFYGSLMVVEFGSRGTDGERMRSNRLKKYEKTRKTPPDSRDKVIKNIPFDGVSAPWYGHPGGLQMIGDILVIALEGPKEGQSLPMSKLVFFDCSEPNNPDLLDYQLDFWAHDAAAPGIVKLPEPDGRFYMSLTWGDDETVEFYRSNKKSFFLEDGTEDPNFIFELDSVITKEKLEELEDIGYWRFGRTSPQSLNFVKDTDDNLYLIGAANSKDTAPKINGEDTIWLWLVEGWDDPNVPTELLGVHHAAKHLYSDGMSMYCSKLQVNCRMEANFNAATGVYISPSGELLYYSAAHYNIGPSGTFKMAELRYNRVSRRGRCGPMWKDNHLGGPYDINECTSLTLDGSVYFIEPWIQMYKDPYLLGQTVMMDWADQSKDNYNNFSELDGALNKEGKTGFNDMMSSFRWCGCEGSSATIWSNYGLKGEKNYHVNGDNIVLENNQVSTKFNNVASSAEINWTPVEQPYLWDLDDDGQYNDANGPSATFHAGVGSSTNIVRMKYKYTSDPNEYAIVDTTIYVHNVPPRIDSLELSNSTPDEGQQITVSGTWSDPGAVLADVTVNWGDSSPADEDENNAGAFSFSHTYGDNGTYQIEVCVWDGEDTTCQSLEATVSNVAPTTGIDSVEQPNPHFILPLVHTLHLTGSFTDPGWLDTHTSNWDFGDGTNEPGNLIQENEHPDATGTTTVVHIYAEPGTYLVTLTVTDDDGDNDSDATTVTVLSAKEAVEVINDYIQDLSEDAFKNNPKQRKNTLSQKLDAISQMIDAQAYDGAINKLNNDIRATADGHVDGKPKNDWINDSQAQQDICQMIDDLIAYLQAK
jgi:PKD repeat protein